MAPTDKSTLFYNRLEMANQIDLKRLGENIRLARNGRGWSLSKLAIESGLSKPYISDLENGVAGKPNLQYVYSIARALGTTLAQLLEGAVPGQDQPTQEAEVSNDLPPGLAALQEALGLSDKDVQHLATIHFRGNRPRDKEGWRYLVETLNMLGQRPPDKP
jgi:transcriptional regulator with XRE-family HTH domain